MSPFLIILEKFSFSSDFVTKEINLKYRRKILIISFKIIDLLKMKNLKANLFFHHFFVTPK